jgi:hypothetical protein
VLIKDILLLRSSINGHLVRYILPQIKIGRWNKFFDRLYARLRDNGGCGPFVRAGRLPARRAPTESPSRYDLGWKELPVTADLILSGSAECRTLFLFDAVLQRSEHRGGIIQPGYHQWVIGEFYREGYLGAAVPVSQQSYDYFYRTAIPGTESLQV